MTDLDDLIARVEAATAEDRELDGLIYGWLHNTEPCGTFMVGVGEAKFQFRHPEKPNAAWYVSESNVPAFTSSIDAAVALVERVLPGWELQVHGRDGIGTVLIYRGDVPFARAPRGDSGSMSRPLPLAVVLAALRALKAKEGGNG